MLKILRQNKLIRKKVGDHKAISCMPKEFEHLPKFIMTRNPFNWYVSLYFFHKQLMVKDSKIAEWLNPFYGTLNKDDGFDSFVRNACNMKEFYSDPNLMSKLDESFHTAVKNVPLSAVKSWQDSGSLVRCDALMDWYADTVGINSPNVSVYKLEDLSEDMPKIFRHSYKLPHRNKSAHSSIRDYYNPKSIAIVKKAHEEMMDKHEYTYPTK